MERGEEAWRRPLDLVDQSLAYPQRHAAIQNASLRRAGSLPLDILVSIGRVYNQPPVINNPAPPKAKAELKLKNAATTPPSRFFQGTISRTTRGQSHHNHNCEPHDNNQKHFMKWARRKKVVVSRKVAARAGKSVEAPCFSRHPKQQYKTL